MARTNRNKLNIILDKKISLSEKFHEKTKLKKYAIEVDEKHWPKSWKKVYFKAYPRLDELLLPKANLSSKISLAQTLYKRCSRRKFSEKPLDISELSNLLFYSANIRDKNSSFLSRFYPSAGARYPLETYVISLNTALPKGVYHYYLKNHSLEQLIKINDFDEKKFFIQEGVSKASCLIVITAVFERTTAKYKDRGYRHTLVEAGHLAQNFYLLSSALDLACCAIGGYLDDGLNRLLDIDGKNESVVYVLAVGNS